MRELIPVFYSIFNLVSDESDRLKIFYQRDQNCTRTSVSHFSTDRYKMSLNEYRKTQRGVSYMTPGPFANVSG